MELGVRDKVALIAGGSRGLGLGIARELIREGASCSIGSRTPEHLSVARAELESLSSELLFSGGRVLAMPLETSNPASIENWISESVTQFGRLDMLVANTGGPPAGNFEETNDEQWEQAYQQILLGAVRTIRTALPWLRRSGGGSILLITSTSVRQPIDDLILSNVFRPALAALAKSLSLELAKSNIRVNTLMPGRIDTDRVKSLDNAAASRKGVALDEQRRLMESGIPLGRYGTVEEFGRLGAFLLSPAASYISGTTIAVDGGMLRSI